MDAARCEMLVVVSPDFQNMGIGTELVRGCVQLAGELGFEKIWLPVDSTNVRARHIYRKCGFEHVSKKPSRELDMVCELKRLRNVQSGETLENAGNTPLPVPNPTNVPPIPHFSGPTVFDCERVG